MKNLIFTLSLSLLLFSCGNEQVYFREFQNLSPDIQWNKSDVKTFTIDINDNSTPFEFILGFRYATGYLYDKVFIRLTEIDPDGEKTIHDLEIPVRDEKGEFIGEKGYDIIDLAYVIEAQKKYPQHGKYTYILEQNVPDADPLHYAMEVGLILQKAKVQN